MPMATPAHYLEILDRAKVGGFACPAINVTSSQTLNAALRGFAEAESDGIVQVSLGTALYPSGNRVQNRFAGSSAADIASAVASGVVKMNVDTQYTYPIARSHMIEKCRFGTHTSSVSTGPRRSMAG